MIEDVLKECQLKCLQEPTGVNGGLQPKKDGKHTSKVNDNKRRV